MIIGKVEIFLKSSFYLFKFFKMQKMLASDKNELLFSQYNLNYNNVEQIYRKGSVIVRERVEKVSFEQLIYFFLFLSSFFYKK